MSHIKNGLAAFGIGCAIWFAFNAASGYLESKQDRVPESNSLKTTEFLKEIQSGNVDEVVISEGTGYTAGKDKQGHRFYTGVPTSGMYDLLKDISASGGEANVIPAKQPEPTSLSSQLMMSFGPVLLLAAVWIYFARKSGMGGGANAFGKSKAKLMNEDQVKVTFDDVAGCDEAKEEVSEMVDFLKDPTKFDKLGGKIPRGALMVGPPGTGKTLLAKAIAGEAKVPFFSISGSDFVEMFVGVGASRVRDMFDQAKQKAPCIVFIDEIDAVGRKRGNGHGGNDEREQTLNQLLVQMDGFEGNEGIIVLAATNQPDVLDKALLRPGRFDRQVTVGLPDVKGRKAILDVHAKRVPMAESVDLKGVASMSAGMSGADLANVINEAALRAARLGKKEVDQTDISKSIDKIVMGAEKKSMILRPLEKESTAYHEVGHCLTGMVVEEVTESNVSKISIMPRGRALGVTMFQSEDNVVSKTRDQFKAELVTMLGGRKAEELVYGSANVTTGASNDIERATEMAVDYFSKYAFGEQELGIFKYSNKNDGGFLGQSFGNSSVSNAKAEKIEQLAVELIDEAYDMAGKILTADMDQEKVQKYFDSVEKAKVEKRPFDGLPRDVLEGSAFHKLSVALYNNETIPRKGYSAEEDGQQVTVVGIDDIVEDFKFDHGYAVRQSVFAVQQASNQNALPAPPALSA